MNHIAFAGALAVLLASACLADDTAQKKDLGVEGSTQSSAMFDGEVRKVDKDAKKITLRHGPMPALDMPAHTMVFQVKDPAMLEQVKAGDKIRFQAEKVSGTFVITKIETVK